MRGPRTAMKSGPRLPQLEKALAQKRRPNTAKYFKKKKKEEHKQSQGPQSEGLAQPLEMPSLQRAPGSLKSEQMGHMKGQEKRHKDMGVEEQGTLCGEQMARVAMFPHLPPCPTASLPH